MRMMILDILKYNLTLKETLPLIFFILTFLIIFILLRNYIFKKEYSYACSLVSSFITVFLYIFSIYFFKLNSFDYILDGIKYIINDICFIVGNIKYLILSSNNINIYLLQILQTLNSFGIYIYPIYIYTFKNNAIYLYNYIKNINEFIKCNLYKLNLVNFDLLSLFNKSINIYNCSFTC